MIFPSVYNGPVQYFAWIAKEEEIIIEQHDHYLKQTYRNRCRILGANGPLDLTIPVIHDHGRKTAMKDVRIDYSTPWQKIHLQSIVSAYASAPFFEFIIDELAIVYKGKVQFLIDLNHQLIEASLNILGLKKRISYSEAFRDIHQSPPDPRFFIHPKKHFHAFDPSFHPAMYNQVFKEKHGFTPNLSIIDLLFNEGMNASSILEQSLTKKG